MPTRRRDAQAGRAAATRARIVDAAGPLFVARGYLDTTMAGIAQAAGVAVQTLYLSFGSKASVLEAALAHSRRDEPIGDPHPPAGDGQGVLAAHVSASAAEVERQHPLDAVLRAAAADPEPAQLLHRRRALALARHAATVDTVAEAPGFTTVLSLARATDVLAVLLAPETYEQLVVRQGWTAPDWSQWALSHALSDLFPV